MIVASQYVVKDLPAFTAGPWAPALNESNRTAEGTGWIGLEAAAVNLDPAAKPGFYHYGKGRIALWPMHVGDTRDSLDLRLPPVFKAMAWAAGKTPSVRVEKLALPGTPRGVRGAVAWRSVLPGRLDVSLASEGPLPQGTTVRAWIDNFTDEPSLPLGDRAPDSSEGGTGFEIPVLPVGKHLVHVQVLRGSRVEDWATAQLEVVAPSAIQSLKLDRASRLFAAGEPITGRVILDAPLPPDRRLRRRQKNRQRKNSRRRD